MLIHIPSYTCVAGSGDTFILIAEEVRWRKLPPVSHPVFFLPRSFFRPITDVDVFTGGFISGDTWTATIMLTNYTLRCPSIGELSGKAAESIFFTCEDRAAAGCSGDSGQLWVPLHFPGSAKLSSSFFFFFLAIWIYLHRRIPWSVFQESHHHLGTPRGGRRTKRRGPCR